MRQGAEPGLARAWVRPGAARAGLVLAWDGYSTTADAPRSPSGEDRRDRGDPRGGMARRARSVTTRGAQGALRGRGILCAGSARCGAQRQRGLSSFGEQWWKLRRPTQLDVGDTPRHAAPVMPARALVCGDDLRQLCDAQRHLLQRNGGSSSRDILCWWRRTSPRLSQPASARRPGQAGSDGELHTLGARPPVQATDYFTVTGQQTRGEHQPVRPARRSLRLRQHDTADGRDARQMAHSWRARSTCRRPRATTSTTTTAARMRATSTASPPLGSPAVAAAAGSAPTVS